jgi:hypothetical protein
MNDVLERLRADNPVRTGSAPSIDQVWARLERESAAPDRRRLRPARTLAFGMLALAPVVIVLAVVLALPGGRRVSGGSGAQGIGTVLVHYRTRTVYRPAASSGASFAYEFGTADVWVSGALRHRVETDYFVSRSGRPVGDPLHLELTTDGRLLEHFQSGSLSKVGELVQSRVGEQNPPCPLIVACGPEVSVDPLSEVRRLYGNGGLVLGAKGRRLNGRSVDELVSTGSGPPIRVLVDPQSLMPVEVIAQYGTGPWPASSLSTTTISNYRSSPLTPANRGLLSMRPHPGAKLMCGGPGGGGPVRPASPRGCRYTPSSPSTVQSIPPDLAAAFAVFRRPASNSDTLPAVNAVQLARGPATRGGVNPALARRVGDAQTSAFVVPGNGVVCLVVGGGHTCIARGGAIAGRLLTESFGASSFAEVVTGLVPDGVSSVTLRMVGGGSKKVAVHQNIYQADLARRATTMTYQGHSGHASVAL